MKHLPQHNRPEWNKQREEWQHSQREQEHLLLTLWQHKHALQVQIETVRELRQVLFWHRQKRARRPHS